MKNNSLTDLCEITTGRLNANQAVIGGEYPFYTCAEYPDSTDSFAFDDDVVLIAGNNAKGNFHVNRFNGKFNAYQRTYVLTARNNVCIDYIYYLLKLELKRLKDRSQGSQTKFLTMPILNGIVFKDVGFSEQKLISKVLSQLDKKIELNNRINTELEAMAMLIYDYWFVQFDFPDENGKPYKSSGGKMVYNEVLKRDIPEGWEVIKLGEQIKSDKTGDWGSEIEQGNYTLQVNCIRGTDLNGLNGRGKVTSPTRFILEKNQHKLLSVFDIIIEVSGGSPTQSTGRMSFLIDESFERFENPLICSNFCKAISLKNNNYFYYFVYQWNNLYDHGVLFAWEGKTSGIRNLLFDAFVKSHKFPQPPQSLAEKFSIFVDPIHKKKQKLLLENSKLESVRDWLLPMLMNGQVTVK